VLESVRKRVLLAFLFLHMMLMVVFLITLFTMQVAALALLVDMMEVGGWNLAAAANLIAKTVVM